MEYEKTFVQSIDFWFSELLGGCCYGNQEWINYNFNFNY